MLLTEGEWCPVTVMGRWTGREAKLLRVALRLSIRDFTAQLGVAARTVNTSEERLTDITPLPHMQEVLDTALLRASDEVKARLTAATCKTASEPETAPLSELPARGAMLPVMVDGRLVLVPLDADTVANSGLSTFLDELLTSGEHGDSAMAPTSSDASDESIDDAGHNLVFSVQWNHRGTGKASVALSSGSLGKRRRPTPVAGADLTVPAHQWLIRDPEPLVSGLSGCRVSTVLVDQLPIMITTLRMMDDAVGGGSVLSLAQQAFGWVAGLLDQASYDERTGRRLYIALAELGQLTGWAAHDAGRPGLGQRYHIAALRAAHSADDRPLGAHILGWMADQAARHCMPSEAVTLIETAELGIRGWETPRLLAELSIRKAYALATLRDGSACEVAVAKARTQIERFEQDSDPLWLYWVTPAEITAGAGDCLLQLGRSGHATALLGDGLAMLDESFARDQQIYLTHLADALARPGKQRDLDAAADRGLAAVNLAATLTSARSVACIRDLYMQMQQHVSVPAVRDFLERARTVLVA